MAIRTVKVPRTAQRNVPNVMSRSMKDSGLDDQRKDSPVFLFLFSFPLYLVGSVTDQRDTTRWSEKTMIGPGQRTEYRTRSDTYLLKLTTFLPVERRIGTILPLCHHLHHPISSPPFCPTTLQLSKQGQVTLASKLTNQQPPFIQPETEH